jgi:hypothetical protein
MFAAWMSACGKSISIPKHQVTAAGRLLDLDALELLRQLWHVGDDADETAAATELFDRFDHHAQCLGVQGAEPFVQEEAVEARALGNGQSANLLRKRKSKRE